MPGYPQKKRDPEGFYLSLGFIAAIASATAFAEFARTLTETSGAIAVTAAGIAVLCYRKARSHR